MSRQQVISRPDPEQEKQHIERRMRRAERRRSRLGARIILWGSISSSLVLLGLIGYLYLQIQFTLARPFFPPINDVACDQMEQNGYHIHAHLTIYINGKQIVVPRYIGIKNTPEYTCYYWLHTHTSDGIIHIEAPQKQGNLALDDFLTIWYKGFPTLQFPQELLLPTGWKIYVNGRPFTGVVTSPLNTEVPLKSHDIVTLEYGTPNPLPDTPDTYHFPANLPQ